MAVVQDRTAGGGSALAARRSALLAGPAGKRLDAAGLRRAHTDLVERWLVEHARSIGITADSGFALCAFGGLGRSQLLPYSDLDLVLLHEGRDDDLHEVAEALWYPLWDAGYALDHSVRTVSQCLTTAADDITVATGLLELSPITGDVELGDLVRDGARRQWRQRISEKLGDLFLGVTARRHRAGIIADLLEPDLKNGVGGARDAQLLDILALAQVADRVPDPVDGAPGSDVSGARRLILDARTELQRVSRRPRDVLVAEYGDEVGAALGIGDRFELIRALAEASRVVAFAVDNGMRTARAAAPVRDVRSLLRRDVTRAPVAEGIVTQNGEIVLARSSRPDRDPGLALRVAAAAAMTNLPVSMATLRRLRGDGAELPTPWSPDDLRELLILLGAGTPTVSVIESFDLVGLWGRHFPEWAAVRTLPARDPVHVYTVDRHLVQTVVEATSMVTEVDRPDLLLIAALVHDLGKGRTRDHSVVGAELAMRIGTRLGLTDTDTRTLVRVVRHHLLLADVAANRDPEHRGSADHVLRTLEDDTEAFEILAMLTIADSKATGPTVWTKWKAHVHDLLVATVRRTAAVRGLGVGGDVAASLPETEDDPGALPHVHLAHTRESRRMRLDARTRATPAALQVLAMVAAAHGLDVSDGDIDLRGGRVLRARLETRTRFGAPPEISLLRQDLKRGVEAGASRGVTRGFLRRVDAARSAATGPGGAGRARVRVGPRSDARGVLVVVRSADRPGLLAEIVTVLTEHGAEIEWVTVRTRGAVIDDSFALKETGIDSASLIEAISETVGGRAADDRIVLHNPG